MLQEIISK